MLYKNTLEQTYKPFSARDKARNHSLSLNQPNQSRQIRSKILKPTNPKTGQQLAG